MRVCLVNPPSTFLLDQRVFPPLGVLRVGAVLEQAGISVSVCDMANGDVLPQADVYGITATTAQMPAAFSLEIPGRTLLGGAHATMVAASAKRGSERGKKLLAGLVERFGTVVAGDGERAILKALDGATGLIDADDYRSPLYVVDQDEIPRPARHLIDMGAYRYTIDDKPATSIVTQLGCPFGCAFCGGRYSPFYRKVRLRSVEHVMGEVGELVEMGYRGLMFFDDELNVAPQMSELMASLTQYQRERGVRLSLRGFCKASIFTRAQAEAMAGAGFSEVLFGFESGDDRILKNIRKGNVEQNTSAARMAHAAGLRIKALMSIGHAGETAESAHSVVSWLTGIRPDDFDVTVITPYPGTPYWDDAVRTERGWTFTAPNGDRLHSSDVDYSADQSHYKGVPGDYISHVSTDALTASGIVRIRDYVEDTLRKTLSIQYPKPFHFDHSMGQSA